MRFLTAWTVLAIGILFSGGIVVGKLIRANEPPPVPVEPSKVTEPFSVGECVAMKEEEETGLPPTYDFAFRIVQTGINEWYVVELWSKNFDEWIGNPYQRKVERRHYEVVVCP